MLQSLPPRFKKTLHYLGLAFSTTFLLLLVSLGGVSPAAQVAESRPEPSNASMIAQLSHEAQLVQQGQELYRTGQFSAALQVWQQAQALFVQQKDPLNQAMVLSNLALTYQQLGQLPEANQAIATSLQLLQTVAQSSRDREKTLAQALNTQGSLQLSQGQAEAAFEAWQKATSAYQQVNDELGGIRSLINQAQALRALGLHRRAAQILEQVNQTLQTQPDSAIKAVSLRHFGETLRMVGKLDQAETTLQQSLKIAYALPSENPSTDALISLGNTARDQHQTKAALNYYQQAIAEATSPVSKSQAQLNQLGLLVETQQWAAAQTLGAAIPAQLERLPLGRSALYARINFVHQRLKALKIKPTTITSQLEPLAQLLSTTLQQAESLQDVQAQSYALGYLGQLYEQKRQWAEAQTVTQKALALAESRRLPELAYRWQWQLGRLRRVQGDRQSALIAYKAAYNALQLLRQDLAASNPDFQFSFRAKTEEPVYREFVDLLLLPDQPTQDNLKQSRKVIESLQIAELENYLREPCVVTRPEQLDQVVDQKDPTTAVFYPIILPDRLEVVLKLPQEENLIRYRQLNLPEATVKQTIGQLKLDLEREYTFDAIKAEAQKVYAWLVQPVEPQLAKKGIKTLVFVLDAPLRGVPIAALHDGNSYLVEHYAVAVALGLELYSSEPLAQKQLKVLAAGLTDPPPAFKQDFAKLSNVNAELDAIAQSGLSVTAIRDQRFTSQAFNETINASAFPIVHLSTHGQFSSDPQKTFILTADGSIQVNQLSELFRARDLTRPDKIKLLLLSACETASGDSRAALGIAGTAVRAGADSTIASLWSLDDRSSVAFSQQFYHYLKQVGMTRAQALRLAQQGLLQDLRYRHPRYWATYVLVGNWL